MRLFRNSDGEQVPLVASVVNQAIDSLLVSGDLFEVDGTIYTPDALQQAINSILIECGADRLDVSHAVREECFDNDGMPCVAFPTYSLHLEALDRVRELDAKSALARADAASRIAENAGRAGA